MTLGKLAKRFNINRETIRFYEREALLPEPGRNNSGYRIYDETAKKTLSFILNSKNLGFTLAEIKELLTLRVANSDKCKTVREQAQNKIENIDAKIADLEKLKRSLNKLVASCIKDQTSSYCPIIDNLEN